MHVYQWTGYPTLTYEVPIDGYDGRISLQTLMRRIARGCLHFVQVSSPSIYLSRSFHSHRCDSLAAFRFTQTVSSSTPLRRSPRAPGNRSSPSSKHIDARFAKTPGLLDGGNRRQIALFLSRLAPHHWIYSPPTPGPLVVAVFITPFCQPAFVPSSLRTKYITKHNLYNPLDRSRSARL